MPFSESLMNNCPRKKPILFTYSKKSKASENRTKNVKCFTSSPSHLSERIYKTALSIKQRWMTESSSFPSISSFRASSSTPAIAQDEDLVSEEISKSDSNSTPTHTLSVSLKLVSLLRTSCFRLCRKTKRSQMLIGHRKEYARKYWLSIRVTMSVALSILPQVIVHQEFLRLIK